MDTHKEFPRVCVMNEEGNALLGEKVPNEQQIMDVGSMSRKGL